MPRGRKRPGSSAQFDDAPGLGRHDAGVLQVQIGLIELRLSLLKLGVSAFKLCFQRLDPKLGCDQGGLGACGVGLLRLKIGARLLLPLHGARAFFYEVPRPRLFLLRELQG